MPTSPKPSAWRRSGASRIKLPICKPSSRANELVMRLGYRARLVVPLLAPDQIVGALVVRRKAPGEFPAEHRRSAADLRRAVGAGDPERAAVRGDRGQEPAARDGEPAQVAVRRQHEPRAAHAAQCDHRADRDDGQQRGALRHGKSGGAAATACTVPAPTCSASSTRCSTSPRSRPASSSSARSR